MSDYILEIDNLTKDFPGVRALDGVSLKVKQGEIHAVCGENGAGKSTLMSVISGVYPKGDYQGKVFYKGKETNYRSVKDSEKEGLAIVHQELALSPYLSIYENIFLGHMQKRPDGKRPYRAAAFGVIDWNFFLKESRQYLDRVGLSEPPETLVSKMGVGKQQLVEIARALSKQVDLLILDEPTSSLNDDESAHLLGLVKEFKSQGMTIIMISHKLNEVLAVADSVTIFRDGKSISSYDVKKDNLTEDMIIRDMVGRTLTHRFPERKTAPGETVFEVRDWTVYHPDFHSLKVVDRASFFLRKGEILAFCGPMGAGRTEMMMSIFGKNYGFKSDGQVFVKGKQVSLPSARAAMKAGLAYITEDRKNLGLILIQDIKTNISNPSLRKISQMGIVDKQKEILEAEKYRTELRIRTPSVDQLAKNLSGGNQQKVVVGRSLMIDPEIFIVDEPTRGIDIGAKTEIYDILNDMTGNGKSIIMISSEMPEALGMADRIYVMNEGKIKGVLNHDEATQEKIMRLALLGKTASPDQAARQ
ncbi:MAG: sugar ABC transporter ATP-binding protein [Spirochaetaceae bacterium]|jgi:putative multiple sugar transport system ATP-binding protein|nr:sugar ABC transporter ATP-binding protein [Spirochaetaceae bacterium]